MKLSVGSLVRKKVSQLAANVSESLEGALKYSEIYKCLRKIENNKPPRSDGFTAELL